MGDKQKPRDRRRQQAEVLGMPMGTARKRLLKALIVELARVVGVRCHVCDCLLASPDDLAIEHLEPWRDDPSRFWDLNNVVLRHEHCVRRPEETREMRLVQAIVEGIDGRHLEAFLHEGRLHVAGREGDQYRIRIRNLTSKRVKIVTTVDGRDVLTGEKGGFTRAGGYVIDPFDHVLIDGFRQTDNTVAAFRFSSQKESYSGKMGTPENVGVIGVAAFREYESPKPKITVEESARRRRRVAREDQAQARRYRGLRLDSTKGDADYEEYSGGPIPVVESRGVTRSMGFSEEPAREVMTAAMEPASPLGTQYGETIESRVMRVTFRQATAQPEQIITIHYDSLENLEARGIVEVIRQVEHSPDPFPQEPIVEYGYAKPPPR